MKKINFEVKKKERKVNEKTKKILDETQIQEQNIILNRLYLDDEQLEHKQQYLSELKKKWQSYKQQDKKHDIYHENYFIDFDSMIHKMVASKMKCFYCQEVCMFIYSESYETHQWTLDRIDNNKGHTCENTVICCLQCNLARGSIDHERFKESKKIRSVRKIE